MPEPGELQYCTLACGQRLAWREWGEGRPLVMLHGWSMSSVVFSEVAPNLAEHYRVLCPDLPGHGHSDPAAECSLNQFSTMLCTWLKELGLAGLSLLGWSLGGQVAQQLAIDNRLPLDKLLLVATTPCFCQNDDWQHGLPDSQVKALLRNIGRNYEKALSDFFNLQFVAEDLPRERYRQIVRFAVRAGHLPAQPVAEESLRLLSRADLRSRLGRISVPTLVMHGVLDQIIPLGAGGYLADHITNAQFLKLPGIGHAPFFSLPEQSVRQWRDFIQ